MVRTRTRDNEERGLSEFELHQRQYGKRLASLLGLGIGMGVLAAILSLLIGGTSEVTEDVTDATGDAGDAPNDATGDADSVNDAASNAQVAAGELGSNLAQITKDAAEDAASSASDAADNATNTAGDAASSAGEVGSNAVRGTQDATSSASNTAEDAASSAGDAADNATDAAGEVGSNAVQGTQDAAKNAVSGTAISKAVNSLQSGEWGVNQVIAVQPDNPILFDYSSAELSMQEKQTISELAQQIKQLDSEQVAVKLIGHASKTGNPQSNLVLSQYRADVVAEELRNLGVDKTINTEGKGYNHPMTNIPASDARQQRTEVQLIRVE